MFLTISGGQCVTLSCTWLSSMILELPYSLFHWTAAEHAASVRRRASYPSPAVSLSFIPYTAPTYFQGPSPQLCQVSNRAPSGSSLDSGIEFEELACQLALFLG